MKRAFPTVPNASYYVMIEALAKLKDFEGLKKWFEDWESCCSWYDVRLAISVISCYLSEDRLEEAELVLDRAMKRSEDPLATARERFMVYFLQKLRFDLALKHMEAAVSENRDWRPQLQTTAAFFDHFMNEGDVDAAEEFCKVLKGSESLDSQAYHSLLKTYVAAGKVAPYMHRRLEEDSVELSQELEDLLVTVCPD